jgi:hypothetical protein
MGRGYLPADLALEADGALLMVDPVKADLADLSGLQGKELSARMKAHADRVRRLISMHEGMMRGM